MAGGFGISTGSQFRACAAEIRQARAVCNARSLMSAHFGYSRSRNLSDTMGDVAPERRVGALQHARGRRDLTGERMLASTCPTRVLLFASGFPHSSPFTQLRCSCAWISPCVPGC
jgi:hypothetical protein